MRGPNGEVGEWATDGPHMALAVGSGVGVGLRAGRAGVTYTVAGSSVPLQLRAEVDVSGVRQVSGGAVLYVGITELAWEEEKRFRKALNFYLYHQLNYCIYEAVDSKTHSSVGILSPET